jgi:hypothetical protein
LQRIGDHYKRAVSWDDLRAGVWQRVRTVREAGGPVVAAAVSGARRMTPMDVADEGFRHVAQCARLNALWCMYYRDTTDSATEQIAGLSRLKTYYAGATQITDRSPEILGRMSALERIRLYECRGVTDAGLMYLSCSRTLREISLEGSPHVTLEGTAVFPSSVRVDYSV